MSTKQKDKKQIEPCVPFESINIIEYVNMKLKLQNTKYTHILISRMRIFASGTIQLQFFSHARVAKIVKMYFLQLIYVVLKIAELMLQMDPEC